MDQTSFPKNLSRLPSIILKTGRQIPVYGKGENIRDWLYVEDHAAAIDLIFHKGVPGETYNIGGNNEWKNIDLIRLLCQIMDEKLRQDCMVASETLITFVTDRAGHDLRYAIDSSKLKKELGWKPSVTFKEGLEKTVDWYLANTEWLERIVSGEYVKYYDVNTEKYNRERQRQKHKTSKKSVVLQSFILHFYLVTFIFCLILQ